MGDIRKHLPADALMPIDMNDPLTPEHVRQLKPVLYRDGDSYCCLLGEDPQAGVFGCGDTPLQALQDWDTHYSEFIEHGKGNEQK